MQSITLTETALNFHSAIKGWTTDVPDIMPDPCDPVVKESHSPEGVYSHLGETNLWTAS